MFKRISSLMLTAVLLANTTILPAISQPTVLNNAIKTVTNKLSDNEETLVPKKLKSEMKSAISAIYGSDNVDEIYSELEKLIAKIRAQRSEELKAEDFKRTGDWYKDEIVYMFYPDQFGVSEAGKPNTFKDLISMFDYLKDLGITTIYVLPFAESPMNDSGFDVKNPRNVRADLGGMPEFKEFVKAAHKNGFKVKADLVLNHFSDEHQWFKQALAGDIDKLNYFIVREDMPEYKKYKDEKLGYVVEYKEKDGTITKRRLIFPEICDNHYRKVTINEKNYYLYHTFYPFQLDVNWENPEVLYYMLDTIGMWANLGIDIFRMDAIPYYIKEEGTTAENLPKTHQIIKLISTFLQSVAPSTVIQAEACQWPKKILPYFGSERKVVMKNHQEEKDLVRTDEVQIAYHFPYMPAIWASLITADNSYFWKAYKETPKIPDSATWALFLRVHDELTLEMVNQKTRELIYEGLVKKGATFRKGYGVSGRLASFLDKDPSRIGMAFSILLSLPGLPIVYYGDEIGAPNNYANANESAKQREQQQKNSKNNENKVEMLSYFDSRDINRGPITQKTFYDAKDIQDTYGNTVYTQVKKLIALRKQYPILTRGSFTEIKSDSPEVFAYVREFNGERVVIINNLSDSKIHATVNFINDDFGKKAKDIYLKNLLTDKGIKARVHNKKLTVKLEPYAAMWLKM